MRRITLCSAILLILAGTALVLGEKTTDYNGGNQPTHHQSATTSAQVLYVVDGDTIRVKPTGGPFFDGSTSSTPVRLIGVDAPEIDWEDSTAECFARPARSFLQDRLDNRQVTLVGDTLQPKYDDYQRRLAYVTVEGVNINKQLIAKGFARELSVGDGYDAESEFGSTEEAARSYNRGLWAGCI
jgi:micrococcal nuclease